VVGGARAAQCAAWATQQPGCSARLLIFRGGGAHSQGNYARGAGVRNSPQMPFNFICEYPFHSFISYSHLTAWEITLLLLMQMHSPLIILHSADKVHKKTRLFRYVMQ
jgi:hypothetical protein